jgi:hypothetical protein
MILNASVTFSVVAPPPTSRKLRLAAEQLDCVHRRHRKTGTVDEAADIAVERDVREVEFRRFDFGGILSSRSRISTSSGDGRARSNRS